MTNNDEMHNGLPPRLSLENVAEGNLPAIIERELMRVSENIADLNTASKSKRKVTITLEFLPYLDRSGATVSTSVKTSLAGMTALESPMYIANVLGEWTAFGKNHKQQEMQFAATEPVNPEKNRAN